MTIATVFLAKLGSFLITRMAFKIAITTFLTGPVIVQMPLVWKIIKCTNASYTLEIWKVWFPTILAQYGFSFVLASCVSFYNSYVRFWSFLFRRKFVPINVEAVDFNGFHDHPRFIESLMTSLLKLKQESDAVLTSVTTELLLVEESRTKLHRAYVLCSDWDKSLRERETSLGEKETSLREKEVQIGADSVFIEEEKVSLGLIKDQLNTKQTVLGLKSLEVKSELASCTDDLNSLTMSHDLVQNNFMSYLVQLKSNLGDLFVPFLKQVKEDGCIKCSIPFPEFKNRVNAFFSTEQIPLNPLLESLGFDSDLVGQIIIIATTKEDFSVLEERALLDLKIEESSGDATVTITVSEFDRGSFDAFSANSQSLVNSSSSRSV